MTNSKEQKNLEDELKEILELPIYPQADEGESITHYINLAYQKLAGLAIKTKGTPDFEKIVETAHIITKRLLTEGREYLAFDYFLAYQYQFGILDRYNDLRQCFLERLEREDKIMGMLKLIKKELPKRAKRLSSA